MNIKEMRQAADDFHYEFTEAVFFGASQSIQALVTLCREACDEATAQKERAEAIRVMCDELNDQVHDLQRRLSESSDTNERYYQALDKLGYFDDPDVYMKLMDKKEAAE